MSRGNVFIVSGPSGSGKDTILVNLFNKNSDIKFSISSITRAMRAGEVEGQKYNFISKDNFLSMIENDQLLEYNFFVDNYYGTPKAPVIEAVENGFDIIIEVDVNGAEQIRKKLPGAISVFIMPPSFDVLKKRLSGRGTESEELVKRRLNSALKEIKRAKEFDYIIVNDKLDTAVEDLQCIIHTCGLTAVNHTELIKNVLNI